MVVKIKDYHLFLVNFNNLHKAAKRFLKRCSMTEEEIIPLWRRGLSKQTLAILYKRRYNQRIKNIRSNPIHRRDGTIISNREVLKVVEQILYNYVKKE